MSFCIVFLGFLFLIDGLSAPFGRGSSAVRRGFLLRSDKVQMPFGGGSSAVLAGAKDGAGNLFGIRKTPFGHTQKVI